jgi:hypothetical protein
MKVLGCFLAMGIGGEVAVIAGVMAFTVIYLMIFSPSKGKQ